MTKEKETTQIQLLSQASLEGLRSTSVIRQIFLLGQDLKKQRPDLEIIDLSLGNPDLEPPEVFFETLAKTAGQRVPGVHRYMDNAGFEWVRSALAKDLSKSEGVELSENSVFMTCGAAGALQVLFRTLLSPGDEVLVLAPFFVEYQTYIKLHGGVCRVVNMAANGSMVPDLTALERALQSPRAKFLILNSPNNPSGCVYPESFYRGLKTLLDTHWSDSGVRVQVISDEPYARLLFEGAYRAQVLKDLSPCWLVRSHSKDLGLAGERIGYIAWKSDNSDRQVLDALRAAARALGFVNAPALMQRILPQIFNSSVDAGVYATRAQVFCDILLAGGMEVVRPQGTFFALPRVPPGFTEEGFCQALAKQGVLVVPALAFAAPGYFRVSLTQDLKLIKKAATLMVELAKSGAEESL